MIAKYMCLNAATYNMALFKATAHRAVLQNMLRELQTFALHLHAYASLCAVAACIARRLLKQHLWLTTHTHTYTHAYKSVNFTH